MRIVFMGTPDFAIPSLEACNAHHEVIGVISQPDRPRGRGKAVVPSPLKQRAMELGLPVYTFEKISKEKPDVIAFQEMMPKHLDVLQKLLPEYEFYGQYRNADYTGEGLYTAIRKDSFQLISYETFWISPTPFVSGSRFEDQSDCPRICVVTTVRHRQNTPQRQ